MKYFFFSVALLISLSCFAQQEDSTDDDSDESVEPVNDDDWRDLSSGNNMWKSDFGLTTFRPYRLNDYIFAQGGETRFTSLHTVGVTFAGSINVVGDLVVDGTYDAAYSLHFYQPQSIVVHPDSLQYKLGGWEFMTSLYGIDVFRKCRYFDFVLAPGFYMGTMRLHRITGRGAELFKNPFVAIMYRADLRFVFGPVAFGARWSYRHDTSKSKWKKDSDGSIPGYRCREIQYLVYLGYRFHWKEN